MTIGNLTAAKVKLNTIRADMDAVKKKVEATLAHEKAEGITNGAIEK